MANSIYPDIHNGAYFFHGMRVHESPHLDGDKAVLLPNGEMVVPHGMLGRLESISQESEAMDLYRYGASASKIVTSNRTVINTFDEIGGAGTLTLEKFQNMQKIVRERIEQTCFGAMRLTQETLVPPRDTEREVMEADPAWGAF